MALPGSDLSCIQQQQAKGTDLEGRISSVLRMLSGGGWKAGEMDDGGFPVRKWEDLDTDILVKIFRSFDIFELSGMALGLL
ncbi:hypothetical protein ACFX14_041982 [Malus domestica]